MTLNNTTLVLNKTPTFLGVIFDRTLSFGPQVEALKKKVGAKCNLLAMVASREWGWSAESLKTVFQATVCSVLNYCGAAWQPWLSETNVKALDVCQNRALRMVTGQLQSTPLETLRLEAEVPSMQTMIRRNCVNAWEKTLRLPLTNPRTKLIVGPQHRLKSRGSWRELARKEEESLGLNELHRAPFPVPKPPWEAPMVGRWVVHADLNQSFHLCSTSEEKLTSTVAHLKDIGPFSTSIYTDGSPGENGKDGGAAAVICSGPPDNMNISQILTWRGGRVVSALEAEREGMRLALDWVNQLTSTSGPVLIASDSRSLISELCNPSAADDTQLVELRRQLEGSNHHIVIQ